MNEIRVNVTFPFDQKPTQQGGMPYFECPFEVLVRPRNLWAFKLRAAYDWLPAYRTTHTLVLLPGGHHVPLRGMHCPLHSFACSSWMELDSATLLNDTFSAPEFP
eukprot:6230915-Amphidinium_carterae.1